MLDEEEQRAELAGPEMLLKQLKELLNRQGTTALTALPDGIHSGLRRATCNGIFFYFRAPRPDGSGKRHFWRYIDAGTHQITDNRFEVAQMIACQPDEPRYIGDQDVFALQEKVIGHILKMENETAARAATPTIADPTQQSVTEELKNAIRRGSVDRDAAKAAIKYLAQPMPRFAVARLKKAYASWGDTKDDRSLLDTVSSHAADYAKDQSDGDSDETALRREDLDLVCFEYLSS